MRATMGGRRAISRVILEGCPMAIALGLVVWQLVPLGGRMGHDYYHYFTRLTIGSAHFWQNGFAVPHYTPSLCGGMPFFADPQSMYYSAPQMLAFFLDPLIATLLTVFLFSALGYWGFYRLARDVFRSSALVSHGAAVLFILNGFTFSHLLVGHVTHHPFLLFPWLFRALFLGTSGDRRSLLKHSLVFSFVIIYTFYSGGLHVLVVFFWGLLLLFPYVCWLSWRDGHLRNLIAFAVVSAVTVLATCSGKFVASVLLSKSFVTQEIDSSGLNPLSLVLRYFWFNPDTAPMAVRFGQWYYGPWEFVGFVSKILIPVVPLLLVRALVSSERAYFWLALVYIFLIDLFLVIASGGPLNQSLPFLRHYHNPIKILGAGTPLLIVGGVVCFNWLKSLRWFPKMSPVGALLSFWILCLTFFFEYHRSSEFFLNNVLVYGFIYSPAPYHALRERGRIVPVTQVTTDYGKDVRGIFTGCTSIKCYEPMFGYRRENLKTQLIAGATSLVQHGSFNLSHPGCLLYPDFFKCKRWDRVRADDIENFHLFINGKTPKWGVPLWQQLLLIVNATVLGLAVSVFFGSAFNLERVYWLIGMRRVREQPA